MKNWFDDWWPRLQTVLSFVIGAAILGYTTVAQTTDRPWLIAAAIGCMGVPLARAAQEFLGRWVGPGPSLPPPRRGPKREETPEEEDQEETLQDDPRDGATPGP